jgi:CubicO group peptidase (beta-lactamase class C family)
MKLPNLPVVLCNAATIAILAMGAEVQAADKAAPADAARSAALSTELAAIVNDSTHPLASLSALAIRGGKLVYQGQFGQRRIDPANPANNLPANADTLYRIASISKLVTTLGVMKMVEDGQLKLDADVSDYLGYRLRNPHFPEATISLRMLLTHTSSLRDDGGYYWESRLALKEALLPSGALHGRGEMWASNAPPGAWFSYANLPWGVIGTIMERVSGERFDRLMQRLILRPMGLHGGFNPAAFAADDLRNLATLYRKRTGLEGAEIWNPAGPWVAQVDDYRLLPPAARAGDDYVIGSNGTVFGPQGGLRISATGLGDLMLMLMDQGMFKGRRILRAESVAALLNTQWRFDADPRASDPAIGRNGDSYRGQFRAWGLGTQQFLDVSASADPGSGDRLVAGGGFTAVGHLGDAWGLTAAFVFNPQRRDGMIFMVGGPGFDPDADPGQYSSMHRYEERILSALYSQAIRPPKSP